MLPEPALYSTRWARTIKDKADELSNNKTKSPLKDNPLRNPGQSLDEEIDRLIDDKMMPYVLGSFMFVVLAIMDWYRWYSQTPINPWLFTIIAVLLLAFSTFKVISIKKQLRNLRQGRDGERAVGQHLELLREEGCKVFHDIVADNFNLDHVVFSEHGFFLIETKTFSKPAKGKAEILFDGDTVKVNGFEPDRNPVDQAKASARWLRDMLKESTGKIFPMKPVVLFPGWYVETTQTGKAADVWVLNPKAFHPTHNASTFE